ncbi:FAD-binding protein [Deinococcus apachensis]|uniref:FAD-binding protein n=1 Tax=Deinococcus apachensis TaxID=309886 RepID=UPI00037DF8D7|nr:FAD-binding protein [Deinococcus apachensis]
MTEQRNWAGNYTYHAANWHCPRGVEEVQEQVRRAERVKVLGSRHSFNGIADTGATMLSLEHLNRVVSLDREQGTVTVEGGIRYGELSRFLHGQGYALPNLASLPHISVAGACATATHGSGDRVGNLATAVSSLELVTADGEIVTVSRDGDPETFPGMVVGLGGLGVVTRLTLDVIPTFEMRQDVYENLALEALEDHFDAVMSSADSVSLFTDWRHPRFYQVWLKRRVTGRAPLEPPREWFGAVPAPQDRHPIPGISPVNCTPQMGVPGPWHERLPHFRLEYTPSSGEELQSEYLVPRQHALAAFRAIHALSEQMAPLLQVSEVRSVAADDLWMSPFYRQPCVGIHFTWYRDEAAVRAFLPRLEAALAPFGARPHWGKVFTVAPEVLPGLFGKLPDFRRLLERSDPRGKFRNAFLDRYIFGEMEPGTT